MIKMLLLSFFAGVGFSIGILIPISLFVIAVFKYMGKISDKISKSNKDAINKLAELNRVVKESPFTNTIYPKPENLN